MQILGDRHRNPHLARIAWLPLVATTTSPEAAPSGTRATMNCSELMMTEPSTSPKRTCGRRSSLRAQAAADDANLASGQSTAGIDGVDVRLAIHVLCTGLSIHHV